MSNQSAEQVFSADLDILDTVRVKNKKIPKEKQKANKID